MCKWLSFPRRKRRRGNIFTNLYLKTLIPEKIIKEWGLDIEQQAAED